MPADGFHAVNESNAYDAAGSLPRLFGAALRLRPVRDPAADLRLAGHLRPRPGPPSTISGGPSSATRCPPALADRTRARSIFDPVLKPAYLDKRCPEARHPPRVADRGRADRLWSYGEYNEAHALYADLAETRRAGRWVRRAASSLERLERHDEALALVADQLSAPDLDTSDRFQILERRLASLVALRRWDEVYATYAEFDALDPDPRSAWRWFEAALRDERIREDVARYVDHTDGTAELLALAAAWPDNDALAALVAARATSISTDPFALAFTRSRRARIDRKLSALQRAPQACDEVSKDLLDVADNATWAGEHEIAASMAQAVLDHCVDPISRTEAGLRLERLEWERSRP